MSIPVPQALIRYVQEDGRLTPEGIQMFLAWVATLKDHEARIKALE